MKTIYNTPGGKKAIIDLYDSQLERLRKSGLTLKDIYVDTSFGKTHLIETGNPDMPPLLLFHGGNATTAYNLLTCGFLFEKFRIFAVDTIGHPGKSSEKCLSPFGYSYGKWAGEVVAALGFEKMRCFAGSFGGGILAKMMCVYPERVEKAVLYIPSGIKNAPAIKSANMLFPMIKYRRTQKDEWLKKCILPMAVTEDNITDDVYQTAKLSIDNAEVKKLMPSNVSAKKMRRCLAPTLVMAAEKDCLFPAKGVIPRAEKIIPNVETYLIKGRGHMHYLTKDEQKKIADFLK